MKQPIKHNDSGNFGNLRARYFTNFCLFLFLSFPFNNFISILDIMFTFIIKYNNLLIMIIYKVTTSIIILDTCRSLFLATISFSRMVRMNIFKLLIIVVYFLFI